MSSRKSLRLSALIGLVLGLATLAGCADTGYGSSSTGAMGASRGADRRPDAPRGPTGTPGGPTGPAGGGY